MLTPDLVSTVTPVAARTQPAPPPAESCRASPEILVLPPGTYAASANFTDPAERRVIKGVTFPCAQLGSLPQPNCAPLQFLTRQGLSAGAWLGGTGVVTFIVTEESAPLVVTIYTVGSQLKSCLNVELKRLDGGPSPNLAFNVMAHIQWVGDKRFDAGEWASAGANPHWIEGLAVNGGPEILGSVQYVVLDGVRSSAQWVTAPNYAGSRGENAPVMGLAFRLVGALSSTHRISYRARFMRQGDVEGADGELCRSAQPQDPLIAFQVQLLPR